MKTLFEFVFSLVDNLSVVYTLCSSIMVFPNDDKIGKSHSNYARYRYFWLSILPLFPDNHPKGIKRHLKLIFSHLVPYFILLSIYIPFGMILRVYFFDNYYRPKKIGELYEILACTLVGAALSTIFSMAHFKVLRLVSQSQFNHIFLYHLVGTSLQVSIQ